MEIKKIISVGVLALVSLAAHATPSIDAGTSRSEDLKQDTTIKRDKSMNADRSRGSRNTISNSRDRTNENSSTSSNSSKKHKNTEEQKSVAEDLNLNGLLIAKFVERYENRPAGDSATRAEAVFSSCKPITGIESKYPIFNGCTTDGGRGAFDPENIVALEAATNFIDCGMKGGYYKRQEALGNLMDPLAGKTQDGVQYSDGIADLGYAKKRPVNPQNPYVSKYARCRLIADSYLNEAATRLIKSKPKTEEEVYKALDRVFVEMDKDEDLFNRFVEKSKELWSKAVCTPWLTILRDFSKPDFNCGVLRIAESGELKIIVNGRATLSEAAIGGKSYKISLNYSTSEGSGTETSESEDSRTSTASKESESEDRFAEGKTTVQMSKSVTKTDSDSRGTGRNSSSSLKASPKD